MLKSEAIFTKFSVQLLWRSQYESYIEAAQNFIQGRTIFDRDRAKKTHLTKLVLKHSVLKQFLPNSQCETPVDNGENMGGQQLDKE